MPQHLQAVLDGLATKSYTYGHMLTPAQVILNREKASKRLVVLVYVHLI